MKKPLLHFVFVLLLLASCKEEEEPLMACGVSDPVENLDWLNERIAEMEASDFGDNQYVVMATYQGQTVFSVWDCCANCLSIYIAYYNCEGELVEGQSIATNLENREVIWKSEDSTCNVELGPIS